MKKVLVIKVGTKGISDALADSYFEGIKQSKNKVKMIDLSKLKFDPIIHVRKVPNKLEKDLKKSQELISWADYIFLSYPNWWATMPAILKGFFDRVLSPKFAFEYSKNGFPKGLLKGKNAFIVCVASGPWIYNLFFGVPGLRIIKRNILGFCGVKTKTKFISSFKKYERDNERFERLKNRFFNYGKNLK